MNPSPTHTEMDTSKLAVAIAEVQDAAGRMSLAQSGTSEHGSLVAELREQMEDVVLEVKFLLTTVLYQGRAAMRNAYHLSCRDIFRHAANRSILTLGACERWLRYCDLLGFKQSLSLSPPAPDSLPKLSSSDVQDFIDDAKRLLTDQRSRDSSGRPINRLRENSKVLLIVLHLGQVIRNICWRAKLNWTR